MPAPFVVKLWGVRGSIPSPGPDTVRYGGNTPCVSVHFQDKLLVLDAGTGVRSLGIAEAETSDEIYVLITHEHWDHIQGFPFFEPIYQPGRKVFLFPTQRGQEMLCSAVEQMDGAHFPVRGQDLLSHHACVLTDPATFLAQHGITFRTIQTNHPGHCLAYRIEDAGRSVVYMPDNEITSPSNHVHSLDDFASFALDADLLIHDSMFIDSDMPAKRGWGHSTVLEACELALAARARHLLLFHHDPARTDDQLDQIQFMARAWMNQRDPSLRVSAAAEGMSFSL